jgi:hypothetical protein
MPAVSPPRLRPAPGVLGLSPLGLSALGFQLDGGFVIVTSLLELSEKAVLLELHLEDLKGLLQIAVYLYLQLPSSLPLLYMDFPPCPSSVEGKL